LNILSNGENVQYSTPNAQFSAKEIPQRDEKQGMIFENKQKPFRGLG